MSEAVQVEEVELSEANQLRWVPAISAMTSAVVNLQAANKTVIDQLVRLMAKTQGIDLKLWSFDLNRGVFVKNLTPEQIANAGSGASVQ